MYFRGAHDGGEAKGLAGGGGADSNAEANRLRAERRARSRVRLYAVANGIDRLMTLTYAPPFCRDHRQAYDDVRRFIRRLRHHLGQPYPYVWVLEPHKDGERLHAHLGLGQFIAKAQLAQLWPHGFIDIRRIRVSPAEGPRARQQKAASYLSKYVGKLFASAQSTSGGGACGRHRYEVGQGFQPRSTGIVCASEAEAFAWLSAQEGGAAPRFQWSSDDIDGWMGPPTRGVRW